MDKRILFIILFTILVLLFSNNWQNKRMEVIESKIRCLKIVDGATVETLVRHDGEIKNLQKPSYEKFRKMLMDNATRSWRK